MSMHRSLKRNVFAGQRNVRKRYERFAKLCRNIEYMEKLVSVYGLPKEKVIKLKLKIKEKKQEATDLTQVVAPVTEPTKKEK